MAIEDALRMFPADEIVISTLPPGESKWLEHDVVERTRSEVDLPMTHVIVDLEAGHAAVAPRSSAA
jgi:GABA permease